MLYRISYENYLLHMLDFFEKDDLVNMNYAIISSGIRNQGTFSSDNSTNMGKAISIAQLYPSSTIIAEYIDFPEIFEKEYISELKESENLIYMTLVSNILYNRHNIILLYRDRESMYIDILSAFIYKKFRLPCVNLDELFIEGKTDVYGYHRKRVIDRAENIKLNAIKEINQSMSKTEAGRVSLLSRMNKDDKLKKLKELGIKIPKNSSDDKITELLKEEWCSEEED